MAYSLTLNRLKKSPNRLAIIPGSETHLNLTVDNILDSTMDMASNVARYFLGSKKPEESSPITGADLASAFERLPAHITKITLCYADIKHLSKREFSALGRALPYIINIDFIDTPDQSKAEQLIKLKGSWYRGAYKQLLDLRNPQGNREILPDVIAREVLSSLTGIEDAQELETFINPPSASNCGFFTKTIAGAVGTAVMAASVVYTLS
jgi:hypothetical protein